MKGNLIGIDLGGTTTKIAFLKTDGEVTDKWSIPTDISDEGKNIVPNIIASIKKHVTDSGSKLSDFAGIGMGTPGSVDIENGTVIGAYNLNWSKRQNVRDQIQGALGLQFVLDNDANIC